MRCSKSLLLNCVCFLVLMSVVAAGAETLRLPNIFGDHMVLQCELPVVVWGWAEEGAKVTVSFGAQSKSTKADSDGRWRVRLKPLEASSRAAVLQVHNPSAKQTIFALNNWSSGQKADVGIGNSPQGNLDYTFRANAGEYQLKRLIDGPRAAGVVRGLVRRAYPNHPAQLQLSLTLDIKDVVGSRPRIFSMPPPRLSLLSSGSGTVFIPSRRVTSSLHAIGCRKSVPVRVRFE